MADHNKPTVLSTYSDFVTEMHGRMDDIAKGLHPTNAAPTNPKTNFMRFTGSKWETYNGTAWVDSASTYAINAATASTLQTARTINGVSFNGSANITVTANTPNTLTRGGYLTGANFNGSSATTWAVDAASANSAGKVVARDASGNFAAGTITAALAGNASTATTLQTARTINGVSFNGSANITVTANTPNTLSRGGYLTGANFNGGTATTWAVDATTTATANKVVARDASGDIFARYVFGNYVNMSHSASARTSDTIFYSSTDNYIRKNTKDGFRTALDVYAKGEVYSRGESVGLLGDFKNAIINGNFDHWQRGVGPSAGQGYYTSDRWQHSHAFSTKETSRQAFALGQTDVPHHPEYFERTVVTSGAAHADAFVYTRQKIEGVQTLSGKKATLSFYAKADAAKPIAIEFLQYFGSGGTPSASVLGISAQKINLTTAWQLFTITADIPSVAGKTLGTNGNDWLGVAFWLEAGTNYNARTASLGQQSGTFDIAQVELVEGATALRLPPVPADVDFLRCARYTWKCGGSNNWPLIQGYVNAGATHVSWPVTFPVPMRANPSIGVYGSWNLGNATKQPFSNFASEKGASLRIEGSAAGMVHAHPDSADDYFLFVSEL